MRPKVAAAHLHRQQLLILAGQCDIEQYAAPRLLVPLPFLDHRLIAK